jgi:hypothetical protein
MPEITEVQVRELLNSLDSPLIIGMKLTEKTRALAQSWLKTAGEVERLRELECSVCPEDWGFVEYIKYLETKLTAFIDVTDFIVQRRYPMNKCQAPGLECEDCRLKCQLPLIEAQKAQRERRDSEIDRKDAHAVLEVFKEPDKNQGVIMHLAYSLPYWVNRAVEMEAEKERCRLLAVDYALKSDDYKMRLEMCENMKLAREFEDLLQTTSIPVAVEKVRGLMAINAQIDSLLDNWQAWSTCVAPDEMIQEYWRRFVDSMINLVAVKEASK